MHLLLHITTADFPAWKTAFDADAEAHRLAGLTVMQVWRDADTTDAHVLMQVNDRAKAEAWVKTETRLGTRIDATYMRTA